MAPWTLPSPRKPHSRSRAFAGAVVGAAVESVLCMRCRERETASAPRARGRHGIGRWVPWDRALSVRVPRRPSSCAALPLGGSGLPSAVWLPTAAGFRYFAFVLGKFV
eukprot:7094809-Prymnesium_polylepis.1